MGDWRPDVDVEAEPDARPEGQRIALGVIMQPGRSVADRTLERIAATAGRDVEDVRRWLKASEEDGLAERDVDATLGVEFWRATADAADLNLD